MEQKLLWQYTSKYKDHRKQAGGDSKNIHFRIQNHRINEGGGAATGTTRRKKETRGNLMEAKIQSAMAQGRGEEHKIFS
jgi:hypothetical protein